MFVKTSENSYYVGFELDRSKPQAVTYCKILLLIANEPPILVGSGKALQSKTDVFNSVTGCTFALKRALADYGFQNSTKILFWKEFNRCYRRQNIATCRKTSSDECQHRIMAKGGGTDWCKQYSDYCRSPKTKTTVPGYGGLYTFRQEQAAKAEAARAKAGGTVKPKKRTRAEKNRIFRELYGFGQRHRIGDVAPVEYLIINNSTVSHGERLQQLLTDEARLKNILTGKKFDANLTARMSTTVAEAANAVAAKLLKRPGITRILDDYIVDPDKFEPAFTAGEVVTYKGDKARVYRVDGPLVSITCDNGVHKVFDHELEPRVHWLRRAGRAVVGWWGENFFFIALCLIAMLAGCSSSGGRIQTVDVDNDLFQNLYIAQGCSGLAGIMRPAQAPAPAPAPIPTPTPGPIPIPIDYINKEFQKWPHPDQQRLMECIKLNIPYDGDSALTTSKGRFIIMGR